MVLLHRQHFLTGTIDALYGALSNSSYQFVLCITIGFGGMITLFQESGALMGFRDLLLAVGAFPKVGVLKRAYRRVESGGPTFERDEKAEKLVDVADVDESRASSAWNAVVPLAFLLVGATVFAVGGCWVVMTIAIPVFVPLALSMGVTASVIIAAVMSGIGLGYSTCFCADAVFMTTGHAALCRRRCGWVSAVRDTGVREPAGRFRREAPFYILYETLTWRAAGDML